MCERRERELAKLRRRIRFGGKKGRSARRRMRRLGGDVNVWKEPERVIATLYGPEWARPPYGFARADG
jgi:hypothetical protein